MVEVAGEPNNSTPKPSRKKETKTQKAAKSERNTPTAATTGKTKKKEKPSREERGYTKARGRKDDWQQFFQHNDDDPRWKEPDFSEDGWAKKSKKKR